MTEDVKRRYRARVGGQEYTIVGNKTDAHMDMVVHVLNERLEQIKGASHRISTEQAAILLAINSLSEQIDMNEQLVEIEEEFRVLNEALERDGGVDSL